MEEEQTSRQNVESAAAGAPSAEAIEKAGGDVGAPETTVATSAGLGDVEAPGKDLSLRKAFKEAVRGFTSWWIVPLCLLTATLVFSQSWLPRWAWRNLDEVEKLKPMWHCVESLEKKLKGGGNPDAALRQFELSIRVELGKEPVQKAINDLKLKVLILSGILFVVLAMVQVLIVIVSKASVWEKRDELNMRRGFKRTPALSLSYLLLDLIKLSPLSLAFLIPIAYFAARIYFAGLAEAEPDAVVQPPEITWGDIAWFLVEAFLVFLTAGACFLFSIYLYIKLYFTGFVITEDSGNPFKACAASWRLTRGAFWRLLLLFLFTQLVNLVTLPTIFAVIPGQSFNYTLRASAYRQVKKG